MPAEAERATTIVTLNAVASSFLISLSSSSLLRLVHSVPSRWVPGPSLLPLGCSQRPRGSLADSCGKSFPVASAMPSGGLLTYGQTAPIKRRRRYSGSSWAAWLRGLSRPLALVFLKALERESPVAPRRPGRHRHRDEGGLRDLRVGGAGQRRLPRMGP